MLYLYALVEDTAALPDELLSLERVDGIGAVVGAIDGEIAPSEDAVLRHARVVEAVAALNAAVLPVRFGRGFAGRAELRQAIRDHAEGVAGALERVRGCSELGLRAVYEGVDDAPDAASGSEYMTRRLLRVRAAEQLAGELHAPLAELARTSTHRVLVTPRLVLSGAYLVPDNGVEPFRDAVARLARRHHEVLLACTGPWPPYSFAAINGADA